MAQIFALKTTDRDEVVKLFRPVVLDGFDGKKVALKANDNSTDLFPASTYSDTLWVIVEALKGAGVERFTLAEQSGMDVTKGVLEAMGVVLRKFKLPRPFEDKEKILQERNKQEQEG